MAGKTLAVVKGEKEFPPLTEATVSKRSKEKQGQTYFAPLTWKVQDYLDCWGESKIRKILLGKLKTLSQSWHEEAIDEKTGVYNEDEFMTMFFKLSARGESLKSIREALMECAERLSEVFEGVDENDMEAMKAAFVVAKEIKAEMKELNKDYQEKKNKTPEDLAEEAAIAGENVPATA